MATINKSKIFTIDVIQPGETHSTNWNNPPWDNVLGYFAYPVPPTASGPHGTSTGTVEITRVTCTHLRDNYNGDKKYVTIYIKNLGDHATAADVWQSWIS